MTDKIHGLTAAQAVERLNTCFGGGIKYWTYRLRNQAKPDRDPIEAIPAIKVGGRWSYPSDSLDDWIGLESARRLSRGLLPVTRAGQVLSAFGVGQEGGSATGRKLRWQTTAQVDEQTDEMFLQFTIINPLLVFRLTLREAESLAKELNDVVACLNRNQKVSSTG